MNEKTFMEVKSLVEVYNEEFKVKDDSIPFSSDIRATRGGWIQASKHDRYGFIIKKGSLFPEDRFNELKIILEVEHNISLLKGSEGTNWTPYYIIEEVVI